MGYYYQVGGAKCSLCGSEGTNKSTCPLNPEAEKPNHNKHPNAVAMIKATLATTAVPLQNVNNRKQIILSKDEIEKINELIRRIKNVKAKYQWIYQLPDYVLQTSDLASNELYVIAPPKYNSLTKINTNDYDFQTGNDGELYSTSTGYLRSIWLVYRPGLLQKLENFFPIWKEKNKQIAPPDSVIKNIEDLLKKLNSVNVSNKENKNHWLDLFTESWNLPPYFLTIKTVNSENFDGLYAIAPPYNTYQLIDKNTSFTPHPEMPKIATTKATSNATSNATTNATSNATSNGKNHDVWLVDVDNGLESVLNDTLKRWRDINRDTDYEKKLLDSSKPKKYKFVRDLDTDELLHLDRDYLNIKVIKEGEPLTDRYSNVIEVLKKDLAILNFYSIDKNVIINKETAPIILGLINHKLSQDRDGKYHVDVLSRYTLKFEIPN
jgi:hypothetical protein